MSNAENPEFHSPPSPAWRGELKGDLDQFEQELITGGIDAIVEQNNTLKARGLPPVGIHEDSQERMGQTIEESMDVYLRGILEQQIQERLLLLGINYVYGLQDLADEYEARGDEHRAKRVTQIYTEIAEKLPGLANGLLISQDDQP